MKDESQFFKYFHMLLKAFNELLDLSQDGIFELETNMRYVTPGETCYYVMVRNFSIIIPIRIYI